MSHQHHIQKTFCTTREAAQILGVSLRTAQLWAEEGLLEAWKTSGGHRRITRESVERLLAVPPAQATLSAPKPTADAASPPQVRETAGPSAPELSILVVEDDPELRRLYRAMLSRWPMHPEVIVADDGYEALILIGQARPDLLIMDLRMPGMDGFRMLQALRALPKMAEMKIVVVSGLDAAEIRSQSELLEDITILPKPIPFNQLREIAQGIVAGRKHAAAR